MNASSTLERRYRRLLSLYPRRFRQRREDEMVSVLMDGADEHQRWPRAGETADVLRHSAESHLREGPPPDVMARRHPRTVIAIRLAVAVWLVVVTVFLCRYSLWALGLLVFVALHLYLAARAAFGRRVDPPSTSGS